MPILTQAPDPYPKTPRYKYPPGAIDTHIHLFGPAEKYPFDPNSHYVSRDALPVVWGTDWPHVNMDGRAMPNDGDLVDLIPEWIEDAATRQRILVENPCELYGFTLP